MYLGCIYKVDVYFIVYVFTLVIKCNQMECNQMQMQPGRKTNYESH